MIVHIKYCADGTGDVIRAQKKSKTYLTSICISWTVFWEGLTKFVSWETRLHTVDISETKSKRYSMKGKSEGNSWDVFSIIHWSGFAHICSYYNFKLMALRIIMVE